MSEQRLVPYWNDLLPETREVLKAIPNLVLSDVSREFNTLREKLVLALDVHSRMHSFGESTIQLLSGPPTQLPSHPSPELVEFLKSTTRTVDDFGFTVESACSWLITKGPLDSSRTTKVFDALQSDLDNLQASDLKHLENGVVWSMERDAWFELSEAGAKVPEQDMMNELSALDMPSQLLIELGGLGGIRTMGVVPIMEMISSVSYFSEIYREEADLLSGTTQNPGAHRIALSFCQFLGYVAVVYGDVNQRNPLSVLGGIAGTLTAAALMWELRPRRRNKRTKKEAKLEEFFRLT